MTSALLLSHVTQSPGTFKTYSHPTAVQASIPCNWQNLLSVRIAGPLVQIMVKHSEEPIIKEANPMYVSTGTCDSSRYSTFSPALTGVHSDKVPVLVGVRVRLCSLICIFLITVWFYVFSYACLVELPGFCFLIYDILKWDPGRLSLSIPHPSVKPSLLSERP